MANKVCGCVYACIAFDTWMRFSHRLPAACVRVNQRPADRSRHSRQHRTARTLEFFGSAFSSRCTSNTFWSSAMGDWRLWRGALMSASEPSAERTVDPGSRVTASSRGPRAECERSHGIVTMAAARRADKIDFVLEFYFP